jgi:hydrogenase-1 operon protein HyaF
MNRFELPIEIAEPTTGMAQAVLSELANHLPALSSAGTPHVIDLTSLPMNDSDKKELEALLGKGEVSITLSTIGDSQIYETGYNGIWWIKHYSADNQLLSELIEINRVPEIIKSHPDDIKNSIVEIKNLIANDETGEQA